MGTQHRTRESAQSQQAPGQGIRAATEHASPDLGKRQLWRGLRASSSATLPGTRKEPAGKLRLPQTKSEGCSAKVHGVTHQRTGFPAGTQVAFTLEVGTLPTEAPSRGVLLWGRVDGWTSSSRSRGGPPPSPVRRAARRGRGPLGSPHPAGRSSSPRAGRCWLGLTPRVPAPFSSQPQDSHRGLAPPQVAGPRAAGGGGGVAEGRRGGAPGPL